MRSFLTCFVLLAGLSLSGCGESGDPQINQALDDLEAIIETFEGYAGEDKVCMTKFTKDMEKLGQVMAFGSSIKAEPTDAQRKRQMALVGRSNQLQSKLANVQPDPSC
jgi:hypothetical protein